MREEERRVVVGGLTWAVEGSEVMAGRESILKSDDVVVDSGFFSSGWVCCGVRLRQMAERSFASNGIAITAPTASYVLAPALDSGTDVIYPPSSALIPAGTKKRTHISHAEKTFTPIHVSSPHQEPDQPRFGETSDPFGVEEALQSFPPCVRVVLCRGRRPAKECDEGTPDCWAEREREDGDEAAL